MEQRDAAARYRAAAAILPSRLRAAALEVLGDREAAVCAELTKLHEEVVRDLAPVLAERLVAEPEVRGECVIVIEGPVAGEDIASEAVVEPLEDAVRAALAAGEPKSALAKRLAQERGVRRREVYDLAVALEDAEV